MMGFQWKSPSSISRRYATELNTLLEEELLPRPDDIPLKYPMPDYILEYAETYFNLTREAWIRTGNALGFKYEIMDN